MYLPEDFPPITGPEAVAKVLGFSSETIRRRARLRDGSVPPAFSIGNGPRSRLRFRREDVESWLAAQLAPQKKSCSGMPEAA
jgi:predicted DNA-binding transcriptional regulator AlpA